MLNKNVEDVMSSVKVWTKSKQRRSFNLSLITVRRPNYPFNCFTLDLNDEETIMKAGMKQLFFTSKKENILMSEL